MKKLLSLLITVLIATSVFSLPASSTPVLSGAGALLSQSKNAVAINDFQNASFTRTGSSRYSTADTGEANYGKALRILCDKSQNSGWLDLTYSIMNPQIKYNINGTQVTLFNEPLEQNKNYILNFDYKYIKGEGVNSAEFSFAPQVEDFRHSPTDFRNKIPQAYEWTHYQKVFNSGTATNINVKFNTLGSTETIYVDNYLVHEAAAVTYSGVSGYSPKVEYGYLTNDGKYTPVGEKLVLSNPDGAEITSVTVGGTPIESIGGKYTIEEVTGDILITTAVTSNSIVSQVDKNFFIDSTKIFIPYGMTVNDFLSENELTSLSVANVYNDGRIPDTDEIINNNSLLKIEVPSEEVKTFNFEYIADYDNNYEFTVSDITNLIDTVLDNDSQIDLYDFSRDGKLTVTDVVQVRNVVLNDMKVEINNEKLNAQKQKIAENQVTYGITDDMLNTAITNIGNRAMLANVMKRAMNGETITVVTLGGSITQGVGASDYSLPTGGKKNESNLCYASLVRDWFEYMFPGKVNFVNAGISGTSSIFGNDRLQTDVLKYNPDFLIVEFAVNDGAAIELSYSHEALIRRALENDCAVLQLFNTAVSYGNGGGQITQGPIGKYYDLPQISTRDALYGKTYSTPTGDLTFPDILDSIGTHPDDRGYAMYATLINNLLNKTYESLNTITFKVPAIPKEYFNENAKLLHDVKLYDPKEVGVIDDKVEIVSLGGFKVNTSSTDFLSELTPMYGVWANPTITEPLTLKVKDCHTAAILFETRTNGFYVKVEVWDISGSTKLFTDDSDFDLHNTRGNGAVRTVTPSYYNAEGKDVLIKIYPDTTRNSADSTITNTSTCIIRQLGIS